jgi:hypothetical protein
VTRAEIVPIDPLHIREMCLVLRDRERRAFDRYGRNAEARIRQEVAISFLSYAGLVDGEVIAIGGVKCEGILSDEGYVWILCSERVNEMPIAFVRGAMRALTLVKQRFASIYGLVAADFDRSIRFLTWMGFVVEPAVEGVRVFWLGRRPDVTAEVRKWTLSPQP